MSSFLHSAGTEVPYDSSRQEVKGIRAREAPRMARLLGQDGGLRRKEDGPTRGACALEANARDSKTPRSWVTAEARPIVHDDADRVVAVGPIRAFWAVAARSISMQRPRNAVGTGPALARKPDGGRQTGPGSEGRPAPNPVRPRREVVGAAGRAVQVAESRGCWRAARGPPGLRH